MKKCASLEGASAFFGLGQVNIAIFLLLLSASAAERHADATARGGTIIGVKQVTHNICRLTAIL